MWQRIQTLYLALATALVVTLFFSVKSFTVGSGGAHLDEVKYVAFIPYLILLIVAGLLQLLSLLTFRVRVFQMRTAVLSALVLLGLQGWLVFDYLVAPEGVTRRGDPGFYRGKKDIAGPTPGRERLKAQIPQIVSVNLAVAVEESGDGGLKSF